MQALATITSVRALVLALQAIRTSHKLPCAATFHPDGGFKLRFLDGSHTMQSGISLGTSAFSHFQAPAPLTFFVPLSVLLESIATLAASAPQELHLQYPGPGASLLITATEDASTRTSICSYAKVATLAQQDLSSLDDMWDPQGQQSQAILPGPLLKEAVDDLEWTGGDVELVMRRSPQRFSLRSMKQQSLEVAFPTHVLDGFSCHEEEVRAAYKYKHLKAAFTNVAQKDSWSTKVVISDHGVLKVTHMLALAGGQAAPPLDAQPLVGTFTSQGAGQRSSSMAVVQFVVLPASDDEGEGGGGALGPDDDAL